jgi:hypothetical protein
MIQRVVTLLLIPCLLLNQSAAVSHSHGDFAVEGHGSRPHIHLAGKSSATDHEQHHHSHHSHSHHTHSHHAHSQKEAPKGPPKPVKNDSCSPPFQHDTDCVYVTEVVAAGLDRSSLEKFQFDALPSYDLTRWNSPVLNLRTHEKWSDWPPPLLFENCPLYLRNLSLLI